MELGADTFGSAYYLQSDIFEDAGNVKSGHLIS